jgi:outer membrane protein insertion porin family
LGDKEEYKLKNTVDRLNVPDANGNIAKMEMTLNRMAYPFGLAAVDVSKVDQERFKWLEYYKIKFKADAYTKVYGKLVVRTLGIWISSIQSRPRSSSF